MYYCTIVVGTSLDSSVSTTRNMCLRITVACAALYWLSAHLIKTRFSPHDRKHKMNSHYLYDLCLITPKVHGSFVRTFRRVMQGCLGEFRIPQQVQQVPLGKFHSQQEEAKF